MTNQLSSGIHRTSATLKRAFSSKEEFKRFIRTDGNESGKHSWINEDLKPTPVEECNWRWHHFCIFWFGMGFGSLSLGSSIIAQGLNWGQATGVVLTTSVIAGTCMAYNSRLAAQYHVGYPVAARTSFGMYGHYWPVLARGVCACLWVSVITFQGGAFISTMFTCMFGHGWQNLAVSFPDSVGTTVQRFIGFLLYWALVLPFCAMRPTHLKWLYALKAWLLPPTVFGLLIYCLVQSKGQLATTAELSKNIEAPKGAALGWLFVKLVSATFGNWSTFIANMPDFSRYATGPKAVFWTHVLFVPIPATLGGMIGIFCTSALQKSWGVTLWNEWDICDAILEHDWNAGARVGVWFLSFGFAVWNMGRLVGANILPFGSDVTALFPVYFNIPRGMYFTAIISLALQPWKILASATGFLAFLNGYGIFMGPTAAIMICDYWLVRKGNIVIGDVYSSEKGARYMYFHGFNLNAVLAYLAGMLVPFAGFLGTFGVKVSSVATKLDNIGWIISFAISFVLYYSLCLIFPLKNVDRSLAFEEMLNYPSEFDGSVAGDYVVEPTQSLENEKGVDLAVVTVKDM